MSAPQPDAPAPDKKLTADTLPRFLDALEILFIPNNRSGRAVFMREFPDVAAMLFGPELCEFDHTGTHDKDRLHALEDQAETRRLDLIALASRIETESVKEGILQTEYVRGIVENLGRSVALLIYAKHIVDRFIPPPPEAEVKTEAPKAAEAPRHHRAPIPVIEAPLEDTIDFIRPIVLDAPPEAPAESLPEPVISPPDTEPAPVSLPSPVAPVDDSNAPDDAPFVPNVIESIDMVAPIDFSPPSSPVISEPPPGAAPESISGIIAPADAAPENPAEDAPRKGLRLFGIKDTPPGDE